MDSTYIHINRLASLYCRDTVKMERDELDALRAACQEEPPSTVRTPRIKVTSPLRKSLLSLPSEEGEESENFKDEEE